MNSRILTLFLIVGVAFSGVALIPNLSGYRLPGNQQGYEPEQPIAYSHALHAGELQMSCQYCHYGAERSRHAGVPSASICMNCHSQVLQTSPEVQKIAKAVETKEPIRWVRVSSTAVGVAISISSPG